MKSTIHKCGEKLLVDLPIELARSLGWGAGDILSIDQVETGLKIERAMTAHDYGMKLARRGMGRYREAFQKLAKS
jgi:bifunctional DNA-binding transcriptional regulator/antitoxin component of YhaV-PrlF toxin-antitoxin module